jgi:16S rRNA (guanine966-N2)-methyltransferase
MRIVGGSFRGRSIIAPKGMDTRPTTDQVRESLFNILSHDDETELEGARIVDLFAGSGSLGLEAISRGAAYCLFVEEAAAARAAIRENIDALGLFGQTRLHRRSATALGKMPASAGGPFTLAFLDAPYDKGFTEPALTGLHQGGWFSPNALCIVEQHKRETPALPDSFTEQDRRVYGDTQIGFLRYSVDA